MFTTFDIVMTILVSAGLAFIFGRMWQRAVDNPIRDNSLMEDARRLDELKKLKAQSDRT